MGNQRYEEVHPKYSLLTTHCGRRTFIVNALYLGIPAEVVMRRTEVKFKIGKKEMVDFFKRNIT